MSLKQSHRFILLAFVVAAFSFASARAHAETSFHKSKTTITVKQKDSDSDFDDDDDDSTKEDKEKEPIEHVKTATFGSKSGMSGTAGCKTEEQIKGVIKDLKADCKAWIKDQKAELKSRFVTSSCEESCDDCGMSLRRCSVTGTIHYTLKQ